MYIFKVHLRDQHESKAHPTSISRGLATETGGVYHITHPTTPSLLRLI